MNTFSTFGVTTGQPNEPFDDRIKGRSESIRLLESPRDQERMTTPTLWSCRALPHQRGVQTVQRRGIHPSGIESQHPFHQRLKSRLLMILIIDRRLQGQQPGGLEGWQHGLIGCLNGMRGTGQHGEWKQADDMKQGGHGTLRGAPEGRP